MPEFDEEKTTAPAQKEQKPSGSSTINKPSAIKLTAKEQLQAEHLAAWDNYKVKEGEEKSYHILVEQVVIKDLDFKSVAHVVTVNQSTFQRYITELPYLGLTLHRILHDPNPAKTKEVMAKIDEIRSSSLKVKGI